MWRSLLALAATWLFTFAPAQACRCIACPEGHSFLDEGEADFLGGGLVTSIALSDDGTSRIVEIEVIESLVGQSEGTLTIHTPVFPGSCGATLVVGLSSRIAAYLRDDELWTNSCVQGCWHTVANKGLFESEFLDERLEPFDLCGRRIEDEL